MPRFCLQLGASIATTLVLLCTQLPQRCSANALTVFNPWTHHHNRQLAASAELSRLSGYDVVLIVDKSYSMARVDCPSHAVDSSHKISRWDWCRQQMVNLSKNSAGVWPDGMRLVLFSSKVVSIDNANATSVEAAFDENKPDGATRTAQALNAEFERYFNLRDEEARAGETEHIRPLLIAVITDGAPNDPKDVVAKIADATHRMSRPQEIAVTFLQVGNDCRAAHFFDDLKTGPLATQAKYDIVTTRTFADLSRVGLQSGLLDAVNPKQHIAQGLPAQH